jgi:hypothetical protein
VLLSTASVNNATGLISLNSFNKSVLFASIAAVVN